MVPEIWRLSEPSHKYLALHVSWQYFAYSNQNHGIYRLHPSLQNLAPISKFVGEGGGSCLFGFHRLWNTIWKTGTKCKSMQCYLLESPDILKQYMWTIPVHYFRLPNFEIYRTLYMSTSLTISLMDTGRNIQLIVMSDYPTFAFLPRCLSLNSPYRTYPNLTLPADPMYSVQSCIINTEICSASNAENMGSA